MVSWIMLQGLDQRDHGVYLCQLCLVWANSNFRVAVRCSSQMCHMHPHHWLYGKWAHIASNPASWHLQNGWCCHPVLSYILYGEADQAVELLCQFLLDHLQFDPQLEHSCQIFWLSCQSPWFQSVGRKRSFVPTMLMGIWNALPESTPSFKKMAHFVEKFYIYRVLNDQHWPKW